MFDKLLEIIRELWMHLIPWYVVTEMENAVILRFGKFHKVVKRGIHAKIPFADVVYSQHIKTTTVHLEPQTLTTLDHKTILIKAIVRYTIPNVKKYILEVWDAHDIINDTVQGVIGNIIGVNNWEDIEKGIEEVILTQTHDIVFKWGVNIEKVTLSDLGLVRTYRLIQH